MTPRSAWQDGGAQWVHLVDLDAAFGRGTNRELIAEVVGRLDVAVELSGGSATTARWRQRWPPAAPGSTSAPPRSNGRTGYGRDRRYGERSPSGSTSGHDAVGPRLDRGRGRLFDVLARLDADGCVRYVLTDVRRDGTLTGPNLDLLATCAPPPTGR